MKKLILGAAFTLFLFTGLDAQQNQGGNRGQNGQKANMERGQGMRQGHMQGRQGKGQMQRQNSMQRGVGNGFLMRDVQLSDAQKAQMKNLQEKLQADLKNLRSQENITVKEQRDRREAIIKSHRDAVQNLLTPEQKAQIDQKAKDRMDQMQVNRDARVENMREKLALNDAQIAAVKSNQNAFQEKMRSIRQDENLSREARREAIQKATGDMQTGLKSILNAEQMQKWQELHQQGRRKRWN